MNCLRLTEAVLQGQQDAGDKINNHEFCGIYMCMFLLKVISSAPNEHSELFIGCDGHPH